MEFIIENCQLMYLERENKTKECTIKGRMQSRAVEQQNLGLLFHIFLGDSRIGR